LDNQVGGVGIQTCKVGRNENGICFERECHDMRPGIPEPAYGPLQDRFKDYVRQELQIFGGVYCRTYRIPLKWLKNWVSG
ncbi:MAG TPA: hypothetical protein DIU35_08500, partial [Candidatus Latescibacteria bacterium]|nr:hypothetical protein [Candidatus Latescibacterota bacterium]